MLESSLRIPCYLQPKNDCICPLRVTGINTFAQLLETQGVPPEEGIIAIDKALCDPATQKAVSDFLRQLLTQNQLLHTCRRQ